MKYLFDHDIFTYLRGGIRKKVKMSTSETNWNQK